MSFDILHLKGPPRRGLNSCPTTKRYYLQFLAYNTLSTSDAFVNQSFAFLLPFVEILLCENENCGRVSRTMSRTTVIESTYLKALAELQSIDDSSSGPSVLVSS